MGSGNGKAPRARNRTVVLTPELAGKVRARVSTAPQKFGDMSEESAPRTSSNTGGNGPVGSGFGQGAAQRPGARPNFAAPPPSGAGFSSPPPGFGGRFSDSASDAGFSRPADSSVQMQASQPSEHFDSPPAGSRVVMAPPPPEPVDMVQLNKGRHIPKPTPWGPSDDESSTTYESHQDSSFEHTAASGQSDVKVEIPEQRWSTPPPPPPGLSSSELGEAFSDDEGFHSPNGRASRSSLELPFSDSEHSASEAFLEASSEEQTEVSGYGAEAVLEDTDSSAAIVAQPEEEPEHEELAQQSSQNEPLQSLDSGVAINPMEQILPNLARKPGGPSLLLGFMVSFDTDPYGEAFELREGRTIISSDLPRNGGRVVLIEDPSVASMHAVIKADADKIILLDQLSECSTVVIRQGQEDLELSGDREELTNGDIVKFGDRSFKICLVS